MSEKNIIFWDSKGAQWPFETSQEIAPEGTIFVKAQVINGTWLLYKKAKYNPKPEDNSSTSYRKLEPGPPVDLDFSPGSFWKALDEQDSVVLFEHWYYGGKRLQYRIANADITADFPTGVPAGVSSLVVWPNKPWDMYVEKAFAGGSITFGPGWYHFVADKGLTNDHLSSLRPA